MTKQEGSALHRVQIGIFGRRNAGKSSLINALTGQNHAIVSDVAGTTTDPVSKAMELLPLGPVVFIDTAGFDDDSELGRERLEKTLAVAQKIDLALMVIDGPAPLDDQEEAYIKRFKDRNIPFLLVRNQMDRHTPPFSTAQSELWVSAKTGEGISALRERIAALAPVLAVEQPLVSDLVNPGDFVVLVTPIDRAAPKGRLILPQQQTIRELLDCGAQAVVTKENNLRHTLAGLTAPPRMVITDSQVFKQVADILPGTIPLTSFSMLFARYNGFLHQAAEGAAVLDCLQDGDRVLISEGCSHHRQCDDIGTVKLPTWIKSYTGRDIQFAFSSGGEFPHDLASYRMAVHCGGCMVPPRAMQNRYASAAAQGIPFTNYGVLIAKITGVLERSLQPLL